MNSPLNLRLHQPIRWKLIITNPSFRPSHIFICLMSIWQNQRLLSVRPWLQWQVSPCELCKRLLNGNVYLSDRKTDWHCSNSKFPQHLLEALAWHLVLIFIVPKGWILLIFGELPDLYYETLSRAGFHLSSKIFQQPKWIDICSQTMSTNDPWLLLWCHHEIGVHISVWNVLISTIFVQCICLCPKNLY